MPEHTRAIAFVLLSTAYGCGGDVLSPTPNEFAEPQYATTAGDACTLGDAQLLLESPFKAFDLYLAGESHPLADAVECQYRFHLPTYPDGSPYTFNEGEPFLGGTYFYVPFGPEYQPEEELDKIEVRNWLTDVTGGGQGSPLEQTVVKSAQRQFVRDGVVFTARQWGVITALPRGEYVSTTVASYAGQQFGAWAVNIFIE